MSDTLQPTADQTVGPFFRDGMVFDGDSELVPPGSAGAVVLRGRVLDGDGVPVPDAVVEIWQTDATGSIPRETGSYRRLPGTFTGWGRCETDPEGWFAFTTVEPASPHAGGAGFFAVGLYARGLLGVLRTRIYVPGDDAALDADPLLRGLTADRRATLVAMRDSTGDLVCDLRLQGPEETVFLAFS